MQRPAKEKKDEGLSYFTMDFFKLGKLRIRRIIVGCEKSKKWLDDSALAMMLF